MDPAVFFPVTYAIMTFFTVFALWSMAGILLGMYEQKPD